MTIDIQEYRVEFSFTELLLTLIQNYRACSLVLNDEPKERKNRSICNFT